MKKIICFFLATMMIMSFSVVAISAEEVEEEAEEKIIFEYDIYDSTSFGYNYVYAGIFAKYSEVNKPWTLEDFPGVNAYSVKDTQALSEKAAESYIPPKNFHQILKFDIVDKTPEGCLAAIRALEASEYVKSANPQVHAGWDQTLPSVDPFTDGTSTGGPVEGVSMFIGDVFGDGNLNLKDALLLRKVVAGAEVLKDITYADVNFDGAINMKDVLKLRKMIAGIDN